MIELNEKVYKKDNGDLSDCSTTTVYYKSSVGKESISVGMIFNSPTSNYTATFLLSNGDRSIAFENKQDAVDWIEVETEEYIKKLKILLGL
jgi:hypothetical protein